MKINAIKNNNHLILILGTRHYQFTGDKADAVFDLAMQYKKSPTEDNLKQLDEKIAAINTVLHAGLVEEIGGQFYLKGYRNVPMPEGLAKLVISYAENDYPTEALVNFWKLCMVNPNKQAREGFFKYIQDYGVALTDKGYAILYKSVSRREEADDELVNFVSQQYTKIKRWKKSPKNYEVIQEIDTEEYSLKEADDDLELFQELIGNLQELHDDIDELIEETDSYYVPWHTGGDYGNKIQLGIPVTMPREECDPDIANSCSYGLHVGARSYVRNFNFGDQRLILAVLVNPANIVALPQYDHSKIRTCEYYPYAVMSMGNDEWEEIETEYFEEDYCNYEEENIDQLIAQLEFSEVELAEEEIDEHVDRLVDIYG